MANRTIELTLKAQVGQLVAGLKTARDAVQATGRDVAGFVRNNERDMQTFGTALTTAGAGLTAMTVGAVKAAIDWETAWAGVQKTNDGTSEQMQALEEDLRNLATTLPATHEEIAATAEMAGQLGVAVDDVAVFTETMVHLGETTNLSAEEAATALARFSNITGTSFSDVDRLGSALVGLGNNFAATESEILHMSERIAAAGTQAGLSEGEIIGLATAMSAVGIEAEAGGTAMTMTFNNIDAAVRKGGDALEGWADLAGTSASEFADIWRNEPAQAVDMVVQGLAKVDAEGGSVAGTLEELGVNGIRQADVLRRLASAGEIAGDAMAMGNEEFEKNNALTEEAALRYETAAAQIQVAWNSIVDAAITAGSALAPIVGDIAEGIGDLAGWFAQLPEPVMGTVTALSGLGGVAALGAGGLLLLAPRAVETYDAFRRLNESSKTLPTNLKNVGKAAGPALGVLAGFTVLKSLADNFSTAAAEASEFENEMRLLADGAREGREGLDELASSTQIDFTGHVTQIESLDEAAEHAAMNGFLKFIDSAENLWGLMGTPMHKQAEESFNAIDEAASSLVNGGNLEAAAAGFEEAAEALSNQGLEYDEILAMFPEYTAALQTMAAEQGYALEGTELYEAALGNLPPELQKVAEATDDAAQQDALVGALEDVGLAADGTVESLSEYLDMLFATGLAEQSAMQAQASYQEALEGVGTAVEQIKSEHGGLSDVLNDSKDGFDVTSEAGRIAQAAFLDVASSGQDMASAMAEAGESQEDIQASLEGTYDDLIATAGEFGITGDAAEDLARKVLGVPDGVDIETWMDETAQEKANELGASLDEIPPGLDIITSMDDSARAKAFETGEAVDAITGYKKVDVAISEDGTAGQVQSKVDSITGKTEYVFVDDDGTTTTVQQRIVNIDGVNRTVYVDDNGTIYATQTDINNITGTDSHVDVDDNGTVSNTQGKINNVSDGSASVKVSDNGTAAVVQGNINSIRGKTVTVTVKTAGAVGTGVGGAIGRGADGGRAGSSALPRKSVGGRLPYTGLGTDQILGINSRGTPLAWVDDLEWIVNRRSSDKYDSVLDRINRDHPSVHHLANLRDGGRAGQLASTAVAMSPNISVAAPPVDTAAIGAAVASAMSGWRPSITIGGREFYGVMQETTNRFGGR